MIGSGAHVTVVAIVAVQTNATLHTLEPSRNHEIFEAYIHAHTEIPCFYREICIIKGRTTGEE